MNPHHSVRRVTRGAIAALTALSAAGLVAVAAGTTAASAASTAGGAPAATNPYSPTYQHAYRQGAVPTRAQFGKMRAWDKAHHVKATSGGRGQLRYGGRNAGNGITTGKEKVYEVFWG